MTHSRSSAWNIFHRSTCGRGTGAHLSFVVRGLVPRISLVETRCAPHRDGRGKPGHYELEVCYSGSMPMVRTTFSHTASSVGRNLLKSASDPAPPMLGEPFVRIHS